MTGEDLAIREEILQSPNGETTTVRKAIEERIEFAQQLAVWDEVEPQFIRATE
jgi:hypothetical protein